MTHYEVLGVASDADHAAVHRAYLRLARRHHPDLRAAEPASERAAADDRMREINEAWAVLGDAGRRRAYDLAIGMRGAAPGDVAGDVFVPFEVDDEGLDPRDIPDVPYRPGPPPPSRRLATMAPVALFAAAVLLGVVGLAIGLMPVVAVGAVVFAVSCLLMVVAPLVALLDASRNER